MPSPDFNPNALPLAHQFTTTRWSVVLAAKDDTSPAADDALAQLCRAYWYPLYAFIRRRGHDQHEAQDLTQEFFYRLLDKHYLSAVDHRKGRFRTFLLAALEHFLANEWRRSQTPRREAALLIEGATGRVPTTGTPHFFRIGEELLQ